MNFDQLLRSLIGVGDYLQGRALAVVNSSTTIRNRCFGVFIVKYEQQGEDRARYGGRLIENLSASLSKRGLKGVQVGILQFLFWAVLHPKCI